MKTNIKSIALSVFCAASLCSCNDFLTVDPTDKTTQDNFFTSDDRVRANSLMIYAQKTWDDYDHDFQWKVDMLGGDMYYTYSAEGQWYFGTYTAVNQYINKGWEGLYNVISMCNSVINDMPANCKEGVSEQAITGAVAEARCMRAYCYMLIAELWHDAPIVENNSKNIQENNLQLPRNTQKSIYRFAMEDLDFAVANLPETDSEAFRCTKTTAKAIRAKLGVTMASHKDYGYDRAALYAQAAKDAADVINSRPDITGIDYSTLFDVEANNGPESILAIQCAVQGYGYGNGRNCAWSRSSIIADQTWGEGKGPTVSLQSMYAPGDLRRKWVFMAPGDYYPNLAKDAGGYTYNIIVRGDDGSEIEHKIEVNAHLKKYIIGKAADCNGNVGLNQDAGNNIYLIRLADIYLIHTEALMGVNNSTSDPIALASFNKIRQRAGLDGVTTLDYEGLLMERRRELALESVNWYDILRLRYREGDEYALDFLNSGYRTGYNRCAMYVAKPGTNEHNDTNPDQYVIADTKAAGASYDHIMITKDAFTVPLPAAATTSCPALLGEPVDYYAN